MYTPSCMKDISKKIISILLDPTFDCKPIIRLLVLRYPNIFCELYEANICKVKLNLEHCEHKVHAIKFCRDELNLSLIEAKKYVESWMEENNYSFK